MLTRFWARRHGAVQHVGAAHDVVLQRHATALSVGAFEASLLTGRRRHHAEHTPHRHRQQREHHLQQGVTVSWLVQLAVTGTKSAGLSAWSESAVTSKQ